MKYRLPQVMTDAIWLVYNEINREQVALIAGNDPYLPDVENLAYFENVYKDVATHILRNLREY